MVSVSQLQVAQLAKFAGIVGPPVSPLVSSGLPRSPSVSPGLPRSRPVSPALLSLPRYIYV